jgi:hypothetical protein
MRNFDPICALLLLAPVILAICAIVILSAGERRGASIDRATTASFRAP